MESISNFLLCYKEYLFIIAWREWLKNLLRCKFECCGQLELGHAEAHLQRVKKGVKNSTTEGRRIHRNRKAI